jgi:hypothetical protein
LETALEGPWSHPLASWRFPSILSGGGKSARSMPAEGGAPSARVLALFPPPDNLLKGDISSLI